MSVKEFSDRVNKKFGEGTIGEPPGLVRVSTGILSLDFATKGGIPRTRSVLLKGPESSGKTYVAHSVQAQMNLINWDTGEIDPTYSNPTPTLWIDAEGTMDPYWAEQVGVLDDPNVNAHSLPDIGENAVDIIYDAILSGHFGLVVLDSIEALMVKEEEEKSAEEHVIGKKAILMNKLFRKVTHAQREAYRAYRRGELPAHRLPIFIAINQPREKVGVLFGNPEILPGGKGQTFYSSIIVSMHTSKIEDTSKKVGGLAKCKGVVQKNKTGMPRETFAFDLAILDQEGFSAGKVDNASTLFSYVKTHLMTGKTGEYKVLDEVFPRQSEVLDKLREDVLFYHACLQEILKSMDGKSDSSQVTEEE